MFILLIMCDSPVKVKVKKIYIFKNSQTRVSVCIWEPYTNIVECMCCFFSNLHLFDSKSLTFLMHTSATVGEAIGQTKLAGVLIGVYVQ